MSYEIDSQSSSQLMSASYGSLPNSKRSSSSSEISKVYKHASQLFLTRRLSEAYEVLQPLITSPRQNTNGYSNNHGSEFVRHHAHEQNNYDNNNGDVALAPIASASTSQRIKIWSLYTTLLNSILDLGAEDGKREFGSRYWEMVKHVQSGGVWEQVVRDGYRGRDGSVDAEVVYNLSNLLLGQASDQKLNQSRLESYLSSSSQIGAELSRRLSNDFTPGASKTPRSRILNGTSTPKDLSSRIKILELFTLHVLPRNDEWDYAHSFIINSDILDDERREAFLQTLSELREVKESDENFEEAEEQVIADTLADNSIGDDINPSSPRSRHNQNGDETDYGLESTNINGTRSATTATSSSLMSINNKKTNTNTSSTTATTGHTSSNSIDENHQPPMRTIDPQPEPSSPKITSSFSGVSSHSKPPSSSLAKSHLSPQSQTPRHTSRSSNHHNRKSQKSQNAVISHARQLYSALSNLIFNLGSSLRQQNPAMLFRVLLLLLAVVLAFSRREVRERLKRVWMTSWIKLRQTLGMGVKVSYI